MSNWRVLKETEYAKYHFRLNPFFRPVSQRTFHDSVVRPRDKYDIPDWAQNYKQKEKKPNESEQRRRRQGELRFGRKTGNIGNGKTKQDTRFVAWQSSLRSEALGSAVSILVLRDAEGRSRHLPASTETTAPLKETGVSNVDASIKPPTNKPSQTEVNEAIDALRLEKDSEQRGNTRILSPKEWRKKFNILDKKFTNAQLRQYISVKRTEQRTHEVGNREPKAAQEQKFWRSWVPQKQEGQPHSKIAQKSIHTGKALAISILIREIWAFKLPEDFGRQGSIALQFEPQIFDTLCTERSPSLSLEKTSRDFNVQIRADTASSSLSISGTEQDCVSAAMNLSIRSQSFHEIILPLDQLNFESSRNFKGSLDLADAYRLADRMGCVLHKIQKNRKTKKKEFTLVGTTREAVETCARAIVSAADGRYGQVGCEVSCEESQDRRGLAAPPARLVFDEVDHSGFANTLKGEDPTKRGRYMLTSRMAKGDTPARLGVDWNLIKMHTFEKCLDQLDEWHNLEQAVSTEDSDTRNYYSASFGQAKFLERSAPAVLTSADSVVSQPAKHPIRFKHGSMGFSQLLNRLPDLYDHKPVSNVSELRVTLIIDPLSRQQIPSNCNAPIIQLTFVPRPAQRGVEFKHGRVQFPSPVISESNILLPALATDVRLTHTRSLGYDVTILRKMEEKLDVYVQHLEGISAGYGNVVPLANVLLNVPFWPHSIEGTSRVSSTPRPQSFEGMKVRERKLFTSAVEFVQELRWDLPVNTSASGESSLRGATDTQVKTRESLSPSQLVYTRVSGVTGEAQMQTNERLKVERATEFDKKGLSSQERAAFLSSINLVLSGLNKGVGLTHMRRKASDEITESMEDGQLDEAHLDKPGTKHEGAIGQRTLEDLETLQNDGAGERLQAYS